MTCDVQSSEYPWQQTIYENENTRQGRTNDRRWLGAHWSMLSGARPTIVNFAFRTGSPPPSSLNLNCDTISLRSKSKTAFRDTSS